MIPQLSDCSKCKCKHYIKCIIWEAPKGMHIEHRGDILELCELMFYAPRGHWGRVTTCQHGICPMQANDPSHGQVDKIPACEYNTWAPFYLDDHGFIRVPHDLITDGHRDTRNRLTEVALWLCGRFEKNGKRLTYDFAQPLKERLDL